MVFYFGSLSIFLDFPFCTLTLINEVNFLFTVFSCLVSYISDDADAENDCTGDYIECPQHPFEVQLFRADAEASVYCANADNMLA